MKVGARITAAASALIAITVGAQTIISLRASASDRQDHVRREARAVASSVRATIEARGVSEVLSSPERIAQEITRAAPAWTIRILPRSAASIANESRRATPPVERLRNMIDAQPRAIEQRTADRYTYVIALRTPSLSSHDGYRVAGTLEVESRASYLQRDWHHDLWGAIPAFVSVIALAIIAILLLTRSAITRPIEKLLSGIDAVARGDLTRVLLSDRDDEIGQLATRFNEMTTSLRESREETERQNDAKLQLEHQLSQTEKLATMGQLAAEIAHEVGTPLNVITGRARGLAKKADSREAVEKNAAIIAEQTGRITRIIQRLIDVTRRKVGTIVAKPVDLNQVAAKTMEFLSERFSSANVNATLEQAADLPPIRGDSDRLQQVLLNLLINSAQAMPDGGEISVTTSTLRRQRPGLEHAPVQTYALVVIIDSGIGIPAEKRAKIFEAFYTSRADVGGSGLGLAVCYGIVKEHDGWIEIDDAPGASSGTMFRIYLPA